MKFSNAIKIYLHKGRKMIDMSIRVSDHFVVGYNIDVWEFEYILKHWQDKGGMNVDIDGVDWHIGYKRSSPSPESTPASYVRISVSRNGTRNHHRVAHSDMLLMMREYFYQKHNVMDWDDDV
jgi:hypothetical protein